MKVTFTPSHLQGTVSAPPSKSMAHRMLICGGLADGISTIHGISDSDDVSATLRCLEALGVFYEKSGTDVTVHGTDMRKSLPRSELYCHESGSTLRSNYSSSNKERIDSENSTIDFSTSLFAL